MALISNRQSLRYHVTFTLSFQGSWAASRIVRFDRKSIENPIEKEMTTPSPTQPPTSTTSASRVCRKPPMMPRAAIGLGAFFALFGSIFIAVGGWLAITQHHRLTTFLPISAQVIEGHVGTSHGRHGTTYYPVIT